MNGIFLYKFKETSVFSNDKFSIYCVCVLHDALCHSPTLKLYQYIILFSFTYIYVKNLFLK